MSAAEIDKRILIVDDEETVGIGMSEMLKDAGYEAKYVTSGKEAVEEVKHFRYSLIFMDMVMSGMNGLETYRQIRKFNQDARVVLFTGYFKDADRTIYDGVREGMIDLSIRKPFFA
ncbi:MAG: response regulator, partial [Deltaproteobacteria bacterium]|nr:response regulator [Deltaproteobacteria bacterium]